MTNLTFYGGVNEIGGNKILLEDKDTKVFLDFGMSFGKRAKYFDEFMSPRTATGLRDFLETGLIPDLDRVYRSDLMEMMGKRETDTDIDAVLLTHAHADHADYISFLHEDIPIYMGDTCKLILEAIKERGQRSFEKEILAFKPRTDKKADEIDRDIRTFRTGDKFKIGSLEVEPIHVDHSVPGAYGFIIHTSEGAVVYTGDIRLHGIKPDMTEDFVNSFGGYPIGYGIGIVILPLSMGWIQEDPLVANLGITFVYASVSFARSYFLRRTFERFGIDDNFIKLGIKFGKFLTSSIRKTVGMR